MRKVWNQVLELRNNTELYKDFLYKNGKGIKASQYFSQPQTKKITEYIEEITKNENYDEIIAIEREMNQPKNLGFCLFSEVQDTNNDTNNDTEDSNNNLSSSPINEPKKLGFCFS